MKTSGDFISMCDQDPLLLENIVMGDETCVTNSIQNQNGNRWHGVHQLPCNQKRVVCKNPRSKHC